MKRIKDVFIENLYLGLCWGIGAFIGLGFLIGLIVGANQQVTSYKPIIKVPLNVLVGFPDGDYKKDFITKETIGNLHEYLLETAFENARSANLTWNWGVINGNNGVLTIYWEEK